jgi:hypothetical protein
MLRKVSLAAAFGLLLFVLACLYVGGVASFSDWAAHLLRTEPELAPPDTAAVDNWVLFAATSHFCYYVRPGDHIPRWAMELAEIHLDTACHTLQVSFPATIPFYKHPSQADLYEATGSRSTGVVIATEGAQRQELHSVHAYDPHEVTHALAHATMGEPPAFFDEGLATAFGWDWTPGENDVHERARVLLEERRLVSLKRLLTNWDFRSYKSYPAYTTAGSFIKYLLAVHGPEKLAGLFQLGKFSTLDEIEECFATEYEKSIYEAEATWCAELERGALATAPKRPISEESHAPVVITGAILFLATFAGATLALFFGEKVVDAVVGSIRNLARSVGRIGGSRLRE